MSQSGHTFGAAARPGMLCAYGFRLFFLFGGVYAVFAVAVWVLAFTFGWSMGPAPSQWHGHEMLFGFVAAAVAGFLLTAVPNWTGEKARTGTPLMVLGAIWLAGRMAVFPPLHFPPLFAALFDLAFFPALAAVLAPPLIRARKLRNLGFLPMFAVLFLANLLIHLEWLGLTKDSAAVGFRLSVDLIVLMIAVVAGRIVPLFTVNALRMRGRDLPIPPRPWLERAALASVVLMLAVDLALPETRTAGAVALIAAVLHGVRLARWNSRYTLDQPILWVLHLGYAWLVLGLALKGVWFLTGFAIALAWIHALTLGCFGIMILGVTTRVALGHTGRQLMVAPPIVRAYQLLAVAALVRVFGPALAGALYLPSVILAGILWMAAFGTFLWIYVPILLSPRPDGRPG